MRRRTGGFTLMELMVVVVIVGVLAAVAVPALAKYMRKAKGAEAVQNIRRLYEGARAYFHDEQQGRGGSGTALPRKFPASMATTPATRCCLGAGGKCAPNPLEWTGSWGDLKFAVDDPHIYQYAFTSSGADTAAAFTASAFGDLDCDAVQSTFEMVGSVAPDGDVTGSAGLYRKNDQE